MNVFLLGATPRFSITAGETAEQMLLKTGGNIGNQVIAYGLLAELKYDKVCWDYRIGPKRVNEEFDLIIIAAANFLYEGFDFSGMANFIEATRLPCVMVGLGAQSSTYSVKIPLQPGTKRLVQVVSERSKLIGVRGPFTADVVATLGIHNVQVVGCPSYYLTCQPELHFNNKAPDLERVAVNGSRDVVRHAFDPELMTSILRSLVGTAVKKGYDFIAQTELDEIKFGAAPDESEEQSFRNFEYFFRGVAANDSLRTWLGTHVRTFWKVEDWFSAITSYDFVVGTRFHGAIVGLQSGVPACVICHDTRTAELCRFLGVPHLSLEEAQGKDIAAIYDQLDMEPTIHRYRQLYPLYRDFLDANRLPHRLT